MRQHRPLAALSAAALVVALAVPQWALARAGGGRSHSSSSHSSSSSSHSFSSSSFGRSSGTSSTGGGWITFLIIAVFLAIKIKTKIDEAEKNGKNVSNPKALRDLLGVPDLPGSPDVLREDVPASTHYATLSEWALKDPQFNEQRFVERVTTAFYRIQKAWCDADMASARAFVSDGVYANFTLQLEQHKNNGVRNRLDMLCLNRCSLAGIRTEGGFDMADVEINATAEDYYVDAQTGEYRSGSREAITWNERWTFVRSVDARTDETKGVVANTCPNCAAPLQINAVGECGYCGGSVVNGKFDWVLSQITQLDEAD